MGRHSGQHVRPLPVTLGAARRHLKPNTLNTRKRLPFRWFYSLPAVSARPSPPGDLPTTNHLVDAFRHIVAMPAPCSARLGLAYERYIGQGRLSVDTCHKSGFQGTSWGVRRCSSVFRVRHRTAPASRPQCRGLCAGRARHPSPPPARHRKPDTGICQQCGGAGRGCPVRAHGVTSLRPGARRFDGRCLAVRR